MRFSTLVRESREAQGLKVIELASMARVSGSYISLVEHGHKNPRITNAIRIAKALRMDIGDFEDVDDFVVYGGAVKKYERRKNGPNKKLLSSGTKRRLPRELV